MLWRIPPGLAASVLSSSLQYLGALCSFAHLRRRSSKDCFSNRLILLPRLYKSRLDIRRACERNFENLELTLTGFGVVYNTIFRAFPAINTTSCGEIGFWLILRPCGSLRASFPGQFVNTPPHIHVPRGKSCR